MGTASRAMELRPVRREVALQVIRFGRDRRAMPARFEAERQMLSMMQDGHVRVPIGKWVPIGLCRGTIRSNWTIASLARGRGGAGSPASPDSRPSGSRRHAWLCAYGGSEPQLCDWLDDPTESGDFAAERSELTRELLEFVTSRQRSMPTAPK